MRSYSLIKRLGLQIYDPKYALDKSKYVVDIDELETLLENNLDQGDTYGKDSQEFICLYPAMIEENDET